MLFRTSPLTTACALLLVSGLAHGWWTARWQTSQPLVDACTRVADVPTMAGSWKSTPAEVDAEAFEQARALAYWMRRYTKPGVDGSITVILMCGQPKYMAVHTPDICYSGAGFEMVGEQKKEVISLLKGQLQDSQPGRQASSGEFWLGRFRRSNNTSANQLCIYWAWNSGDGWQAPLSPRSTFGRAPYLYKLYVVHELPAQSGDAVTAEFLRTLLPVLDDSLFGGKSAQP